MSQPCFWADKVLATEENCGSTSGGDLLFGGLLVLFGGSGSINSPLYSFEPVGCGDECAGLAEQAATSATIVSVEAFETEEADCDRSKIDPCGGVANIVVGDSACAAFIAPYYTSASVGSHAVSINAVDFDNYPGLLAVSADDVGAMLDLFPGLDTTNGHLKLTVSTDLGLAEWYIVLSGCY